MTSNDFDGGLTALNTNQTVRLLHHVMSILGVPVLGFLLVSQWSEYRQTIDLVSQQQLVVTQLSTSLQEGFSPRLKVVESDIDQIQNTRFTRTEAEQVGRRLDALENEMKELRVMARSILEQSRVRSHQ